MNIKQKWLEISSLEVWIENNKVFRDINLNIAIGENTVILGENGSGKSTLVKLISRDIYPVIREYSSLKIFGEEKFNLWDLRKNIGFFSTELVVRNNSNKTIFEILVSAFYGSLINGPKIKADRFQKERVIEVLKQFDLTHLSDSKFSELSDGQRRRTLIAKAIIHKPKVLILDEPIISLDIKSKYKLLYILNNLCEDGTTILMLTHQVDSIFKSINRVLFMKGGEIIKDGKPEQILTSTNLSELYQIKLRIIEHNGYRQLLPF